MKKLLVIGGGLAGLGAAWEAQRAGMEVKVLEISPQAGGVVQSQREEGHLYESGPNTLLAVDPYFLRFIHDLGLENEILDAAPAARERFIVRGGKLVPAPLSPGQFLTTPLFSAAAKLRLLGEPWAKKRPAENAGEESLADFARRRLGAEVFTYGLEPFVAGIFAGEPEKLSVRHAFPKLQKMEVEHGSIGQAVWRAIRERKGKNPRRLISFHEGMAALPRALAAQLGENIELQSKLQSLGQDDSGKWRAGWQTPADSKQDVFDGVVIAIPAHALPNLPLPVALAKQLAPLAKIEYPPVSVVVLSYPRHAISHPRDGFGTLVPRAENLSILGVLFSSTLFPGRAPVGEALLTVFVGGARQPELTTLPDEKLVAMVQTDLKKLLGVSAPPVFQRILRWARAIPQYGLNHAEMLAAIESTERDWRGLALAGSYRGGISVPQCLATGRAAGRRALNLSPNPEEPLS